MYATFCLTPLPFFLRPDLYALNSLRTRSGTEPDTVGLDRLPDRMTHPSRFGVEVACEGIVDR